MADMSFKAEVSRDGQYCDVGGKRAVRMLLYQRHFHATINGLISRLQIMQFIAAAAARTQCYTHLAHVGQEA